MEKLEQQPSPKKKTSEVKNTKPYKPEHPKIDKNDLQKEKNRKEQAEKLLSEQEGATTIKIYENSRPEPIETDSKVAEKIKVGDLGKKFYNISDKFRDKFWPNGLLVVDIKTGQWKERIESYQLTDDEKIWNNAWVDVIRIKHQINSLMGEGGPKLEKRITIEKLSRSRWENWEKLPIISNTFSSIEGWMKVFWSIYQWNRTSTILQDEKLTPKDKEELLDDLNYNLDKLIKQNKN